MGQQQLQAVLFPQVPGDPHEGGGGQGGDEHRRIVAGVEGQRIVLDGTQVVGVDGVGRLGVATKA